MTPVWFFFKDEMLFDIIKKNLQEGLIIRQQKEKAILVGSKKDSIDELKRLAATAGVISTKILFHK